MDIHCLESEALREAVYRVLVAEGDTRDGCMTEKHSVRLKAREKVGFSFTEKYLITILLSVQYNTIYFSDISSLQ
jgi:hypothetical protein